MLNRILLGVLLVCGLSVTLPAAAADTTESQRFRLMDRNNNGYIDQYEAQGRHLIFYYYSQADLNSDGHIDKMEFRAFEKAYPHTKKRYTQSTQ